MRVARRGLKSLAERPYISFVLATSSFRHPTRARASPSVAASSRSSAAGRRGLEEQQRRAVGVWQAVVANRNRLKEAPKLPPISISHPIPCIMHRTACIAVSKNFTRDEGDWRGTPTLASGGAAGVN
jgi:hypothetical protein